MPIPTVHFQAINSRKENAKLQNFLSKIERQVLYRV